MTLRERFIDVMNIRQLQPNSIRTYLCILDNFEKWIEDNSIKLEEATQYQLKNYIASTDSASLIRQRIGVIKNIYEFCLGQGFKTYGLPYPRRKKILPQYFTIYELNQIFSKVKNKKQLCIIKLQYACALRVNEVVKIKRTDELIPARKPL